VRRFRLGSLLTPLIWLCAGLVSQPGDRGFFCVSCDIHDIHAIHAFTA
jgi:hypothetical protein